MLLSNIIFVIVFMATASSAEHYQIKGEGEEEAQESRIVLRTFKTKEQFEPFEWETVTTTIYSDDRLFKGLRNQYPYPKIPSYEKPEFLRQQDILACGDIRENAEGTSLRIDRITESVGVILNGAEYSGAYHPSRMDLREFCNPQNLKENGTFAKWLDRYKAKEINFSKAKVFIASSFWTQNVDDVIALLIGRGFEVHSMSIPDLQLSPLVDAETEVSISSISPYLERILALEGRLIPLSTQLSVNTQTGEAWCNHSFRE